MRREALLTGLLTLLAIGLLATVVEAQSRPGTLVAITNDGVPPGTGTMVSIDRNTGVGSAITTLAAPGVSLSFSDHDGKLYGSFTIRRTLPLPAQSQLVTLDPVTGAVTENIGIIVDSLLPSVEYIVAGMGFADGGTLYGVEARTDALVTIDTATAQATPVGGLGIDTLNYGGTVADGVF
jgi:hypothetical protein